MTHDSTLQDLCKLESVVAITESRIQGRSEALSRLLRELFT